MRTTITLVLAMLASAPAAAATMLDQQNIVPAGTNTSTITSGGAFGFRAAQTITAGLTGMVTKIDVQGKGFTGLNVFATTDGVPNGLLLDTSSTPIQDTFGFIGFLTNFSVTAGQVFAIEVTGGPGVTPTAGNTYAGGSRFFLNPMFAIYNFVPDVMNDIGFLTYVNDDVASVPEPATWLTMIAGFGALGLAMRRRKPAGTAPATAEPLRRR